MRRAPAAALALLVALGAPALAGCGTTAQRPAAPSSGDAGGGAPAGEVLVLAAASLTDVLAEVEADVEAAHPGLDVVVSAAGSQAVAAQVVQGAPADVVALAGEVHMAALAEQGLLAGPPQVVARNGLAIAVEAGNPLGIEGLEDLQRPDVALVLAAPEVPAGAAAARALAAAGVAAEPVSLEGDVRAALSRVALGEADAAVVYASDLAGPQAPRAVEGVAVAPAHDVAVDHPVAVLASAPNPGGAQLVVDHLTGPEGQAALTRAGFGEAP